MVVVVEDFRADQLCPKAPDGAQKGLRVPYAAEGEQPLALEPIEFYAVAVAVSGTDRDVRGPCDYQIGLVTADSPLNLGIGLLPPRRHA